MTLTHETEPPDRSGAKARGANTFTRPKEGDREMIREELNQLLIDASKDGDAGGVQRLLETGADANTHNDYAIRVASFHGRAEVVKMLLDAGANIHARDDYALRWASENGHDEVVQLLLAAGANVHARDDYALRSAVEYGHDEVIKILTNWKGANK